jgi:nicotinic acid phosphoribosyltransferase
MHQTRIRLLSERETLQYGEYRYFENMLDLYPTGIVSVVSDTYDLWHVITNYLPRLKSRILARDGKLVLRPDSGDPELILLGDPNALEGSPANLGVLELLWNEFGGTINTKGYRVLDPRIGVIYGDGIYYERLVRILVGMERKGYATVIPFGIGGLLLQQFSRDTLAFAIKATYVEANGEGRDIMKDPITDHAKKSFKGRVVVTRDPITQEYVTRDQVSQEEAAGGLLQLIYRNGVLYNSPSLAEIRTRLAAEPLPAGFVPTMEELYALADATPLSRYQTKSDTAPLSFETVRNWLATQGADFTQAQVAEVLMALGVAETTTEEADSALNPAPEGKPGSQKARRK